MINNEKKGYLCGLENQNQKAMEKYIRFDWAAKHMLRDKANFDILEGFLTVLLGEKITIVEILESESNKDNERGKTNRVDIKARNTRDEIIIVEIQQAREMHYLERILFGASKAVTEHIEKGLKYEQIKKVYSINIIYFDMGTGDDYIYHGETVFRGVNKHDILQVNDRERDILGMRPINDVFPEYYILRVNSFNKKAETPLEEWMDYFGNGNIKDDTIVPGLEEARKKLIYMMMSDKERRVYDRHFMDIAIYEDQLETAMLEGRAIGLEKGLAEGHQIGLEKGLEKGLEEGLEKGLEKGRKEGRKEAALEMAAKMKRNGLPFDLITEITGLPVKEIENL